MDVTVRRKILESNMAALKKRTAEVRRKDSDLVARQRKLRMWYLQVMSGDSTTAEDVDVVPRRVKLTKSTSNVAEYRRDRNGGNVDEVSGHMRMLSSKYAERRALMTSTSENRGGMNSWRDPHVKPVPSRRVPVDYVLIRPLQKDVASQISDKPLTIRPSLCRNTSMQSERHHRLHHTNSEHGDSKRLTCSNRCDVVRKPCGDATPSSRTELCERTNNNHLKCVRSVKTELNYDGSFMHRLQATISDSNPGVSPVHVKRLASSGNVQCTWC